jgi:hypothetical protein
MASIAPQYEIGVRHLPVVEAHGMQHAIAIEEMVAACWKKLRVPTALRSYTPSKHLGSVPSTSKSWLAGQQKT